MGSHEDAAQDGAWQGCLLLPQWGDLPWVFVMAEETEAREVKQGNRVNGHVMKLVLRRKRPNAIGRE